MAIVRVCVRPTGPLLPLGSWWLIWLVRPMADWDEDLMAVWLAEHDVDEEGFWYAEKKLAQVQCINGIMLHDHPGNDMDYIDGWDYIDG